MKRIKQMVLDDVTVGMLLGMDVTDSTGNILLTKATVLTREHITRLKDKNISKIPVLVEDNLSQEQECEQIKQFINHLFRKFNNDDAVMQKLKSVLMEYRTSETSK